MASKSEFQLRTIQKAADKLVEFKIREWEVAHPVPPEPILENPRAWRSKDSSYTEPTLVAALKKVMPNLSAGEKVRIFEELLKQCRPGYNDRCVALSDISDLLIIDTKGNTTTLHDVYNDIERRNFEKENQIEMHNEKLRREWSLALEAHSKAKNTYVHELEKFSNNLTLKLISGKDISKELKALENF